LSVNFQIGDRSPLHATSIGKVLLAYQDESFLESFVASGLSRFTEETIVDGDTLRRELERIRTQGYGLDQKEFSPNMRCIAVPVIQGDRGVRSGISISGPTSRFTAGYLAKLKEPMLRASEELSRQLGGIPWQP
ncbi:MAG: IclR family transcriptional regulator C-terminal domain-containing protein, partial [Spirochaetia bacterium]